MNGLWIMDGCTKEFLYGDGLGAKGPHYLVGRCNVGGVGSSDSPVYSSGIAARVFAM